MQPRNLLEMAQAGDMHSPDARIHHAHSLAPARVALTALRVGRTFLERWPVCDIHPENDWRRDSYTSNAPATFILHDVIVHSRSGLLLVGNEVVAETIVFSDPEADGYLAYPDGLMMRPSRVTSLAGTHVTTLYGNSGNYYHAIVDGVARLSMVPPSLLEAAQSILYSGAPPQAFTLQRITAAAKLAQRSVIADEAFHVEALILPLSLHHNGAFHPCLSGFFDGISASVPDGDEKLPRRFYVDRRGSAARRLLNETEVIDRLRPLGFVPVRPEEMSLAQQVRLFRSAQAIVSPHGAALTNLGWCRPGCAVLELHMDAHAHWFYRNLAGLRALRYDCVFGRAIDAWPGDRGRTQDLRWVISADHVAAGADFLVDDAS